MIVHTIPPVYDSNSKILILGSFPSVKSLEQGFFYGHPQNRFWKVLASVFGAKIPDTVAEKREFLLKHGVAVWDVIGECDIVGSSDLSIKNVKSNDISVILKSAKIDKIFLNGKTAEKYYKKYLEKSVGIAATLLPSTSPANAICSLEKLIDAWKIIKD